MWRLYAALVMALSLAGCATTDSQFTSTVMGRADPSFTPRLSHAVVAADAGQAGDPGFPELAAATRRMLMAAGLAVLPAGRPSGEADVAVTVAYTVGAPQIRVDLHNRPIYGEVGIASSTTVERTNKRGEKISTTTYTPRIEIVDYELSSSTNFTYAHTLSITGVRKGADPRAAPLWAVDAAYTAWTPDPKQTSAFLLRAVQAYVGKSTGMRETVQFPNADPGVNFILSGAPAPKGLRAGGKGGG